MKFTRFLASCSHLALHRPPTPPPPTTTTTTTTHIPHTRPHTRAAAMDSGAEPHFITECFFLTSYALHVGFMRALRGSEQLLKV